MYSSHTGKHPSHAISVSEEVRAYVRERNSDFRVCTSCGGPILLSTDIKPPKATDTEIYVEGHTIFISMFQARYIDRIDIEMIPQFCLYGTCERRPG
jgi:hypothetical protein